LAVIGLTSIFVAPLVFSPQGREAAHDISVHGQELANEAAKKGRVLAQNGKLKAAELSSTGKQTAVDLSSRANQAATDLSAQARSTASDTTGTVTENIRKLPQMGSNTINETQNTLSSVVGDAKRHVNPSSTKIDGSSVGN
jgi:hypothetical protein